MALKLQARATRRWMWARSRAGSSYKPRMRNNQGKLRPPFDSLVFFDSDDVRLYLGDPAGSLDRLQDALDPCEHRWRAETFRSALQLPWTGVKPGGLELGLTELEAAVAGLSD